MANHRARAKTRPVLPALLLALFPAALVVLVGAGSTDGGGSSVAVRLSPEAYGLAAEVPARQTIDYGAFVWLELDAEGYAALLESGVAFERMRDPSRLGLSGATISTEPAGEALAPAAAAETGPGFRLLQLVGPAKDEWIVELETAGVEILQYIDPNAYLVWTSLAPAFLEQLESVRWAGDYPTGVKILPDLWGRSGDIANVDVAIYDDGRADDAIAVIEALGGTLVEREPGSGQDAFVQATFVLPASAVDAVAAIGVVAWLGYRQPVDPLEDEMSDQIIAGNFNPLNPGYNAFLTNNGVNGNGISIGLVDTGYDNGVDNANTHPDLTGRLNFVGAPNDTDGHGTHVGGIMAGNASVGTLDASNFLMGLGVAPQATLIVRVNSGLHPARQRDIVIRGGVASNNSYALHAAGAGYDGTDRAYDLLVRDADQTTAAVEPLSIVFSAGNSGVTGPTKEAKNVIAVANSFNNRDGTGNPGIGNINNISATSSRGPAQDGRTYPHVAAPGTNVISTQSATGVVNCLTAATGAPAADPTYSMCSGTSMAAPHVTGSVALLAQWWQGFNAGANPSPAMAKALFVNGAFDLGTADIPNNNEGWGRVDLTNVINSGLATFYVDQTTVFGSSGQTWSAEFVPDNSGQPIKVTLVWSDAAAMAAANPTLVNDLDLTVAESGTTYLGNDFANGVSTTGGAADTLNNAENVFLPTPTGASFVVTVTASNVGGNGIPGNADATDQDFALVVQNALEVATVNIVKEVDEEPDGLFDDDPSGWTFDVFDDGNPTQTTGATGTLSFKVLPGSYDIDETDGPAGLWLTSASCEDDDSGLPVGTGITDVEYEPPQTAGVTGVTLVAQQSITCTFQNQSDDAVINVLKRVDDDPDDVFDDPRSGWTFDVFDDGKPSQVTDATGMLTFVVRPGTYAVRETGRPPGDTGYWLVTAACLDDADGTMVGTAVQQVLFGPLLAPVAVTGVDPLAGDSLTCSFRNQRMAGFVTGGGQIRTSKGKTGKKVGFAGVVGVALDGTFHGNYQTKFHSVSKPSLVGQHFKSSSVISVVLRKEASEEPPDPPTAVFNHGAWSLQGELAGQACLLHVKATDHGEPSAGKNAGSDSDSIRLTLDCPGTSLDYDTATDFAQEEAPSLHHLDSGNLQIHPPRE